MDLQSFDITNMFLGLFFSIVGYAYYRYGKKQENNFTRYTGIVLMLYPYVVFNTVMLVIVGLVLMVLPKLAKRN